jgi:hypothetical protein
VVFDNNYELTTVKAEGILFPLQYALASDPTNPIAYVWTDNDSIYAINNTVVDAELPPKGGTVFFDPENAITFRDDIVAAINDLLGTDTVTVLDLGKRFKIFYDGQEIDFSSPEPYALIFPRNLTRRPIVYEVTIWAVDEATGVYILMKTINVTVIDKDIAEQPGTRRQLTIPYVTGILTDPPAGIHFVPSTYSFTIRAKEGYSIADVKVSTGNAYYDAGILMEPLPDNGVKVTLRGVFEEVELTITGVVPASDEYSSTSNGLLSQNDARAWASGGYLYIRTPKAETVSVYTFSGQRYKLISVAAGEQSFPLPNGQYIVVLGKSTYKVVL